MKTSQRRLLSVWESFQEIQTRLSFAMKGVLSLILLLFSLSYRKTVGVQTHFTFLFFWDKRLTNKKKMLLEVAK